MNNDKVEHPEDLDEPTAFAEGAFDNSIGKTVPLKLNDLIVGTATLYENGGLKGVLNTGKQFATVLDMNGLRKAAGAEPKYEACGTTHPHVIHPAAKGPQPCANMCGAIVERLDERNNHE